MHARYEQGVVLQNDITRYELLVENLSLELIRIDNTLAILNRNLVVTAGLPDGMEVVSMKEIYGWPWAIFPKWKSIRRTIRNSVRPFMKSRKKAGVKV